MFVLKLSGKQRLFWSERAGCEIFVLKLSGIQSMIILVEISNQKSIIPTYLNNIIFSERKC